jgi:hypothetical protein
LSDNTNLTKHQFIKQLSVYKNNVLNKAFTLYLFDANNLYSYGVLLSNVRITKLNNVSTYIQKLTPIKWYTKVHKIDGTNMLSQITLFLRAAKHFNKGRYSRNRQLYRTGVYWCIWLNVVLVYGLHFYFYRVVFAFGYLWLPLGVMVLSMFSSRLYKYRYYDVRQIKIELIEYFNFLFINFQKISVIFKTKKHGFFKTFQNAVLNSYYLVFNRMSIGITTRISKLKQLIYINNK